MYETIRKRLMWFIIILIAFKYASGLEAFQSKKYKIKGYEVLVPEGWKHSKKLSKSIKAEDSYQVTNIAVFVPKEHIKWKEEELEAKISIFSVKLDSALWLEDEWADIVMSIRKSGVYVIDKGQMMFGREKAKSIFFHDKEAKILTIEFYIITETNMFFKLQYTAQDYLFGKYRPGFEQFRQNFTIKPSLF